MKFKHVFLKLLGMISLGAILIPVGCSNVNGGYSAPTTNIGYAQPAAEKRPPINFAENIPATGKSVFIFDPKQVAWAAYNPQGQLIRTGIASGGANYCPDIQSACRTPVGTFTVHREGGPDCKSSKFPLGEGGAPMPHCAFFTGGYAVHGSYDVPAHNASHGCIRVTPSDAAWLDANVLNTGSTVIVRSYN